MWYKVGKDAEDHENVLAIPILQNIKVTQEGDELVLYKEPPQPPLRHSSPQWRRLVQVSGDIYPINLLLAFPPPLNSVHVLAVRKCPSFKRLCVRGGGPAGAAHACGPTQPIHDLPSDAARGLGRVIGWVVARRHHRELHLGRSRLDHHRRATLRPRSRRRAA